MHIIHAALAIGLAGFLNTLQAFAQIPSADRPNLMRQGFTAADLQAFSITEIAPHYRYYVEWRRCAGNIAQLALQSNKSVAEAYAIAIMSCADDEGEARSVIAKSTGLAKATRILAVGKAMLKMRIDEHVREQTKPLPYGLERVGQWEMHRGAGVCRIALPNSLGVLLEARRDDPRLEMTFIQVGKQTSIHTDNPVLGPREYLVLLDSPSDAHLGVVEFQLRYPGADTTLRSFYPTEQQLSLMDEAGSVQFLRRDISMIINFSIRGIREARATVRRCAAGQ